MPTLAARIRAAVAAAQHRKVTLTCGGRSVTLPITSPTSEISGLAADWKQVPRPGGKPFLAKAGGKLIQSKLDATLIHPDRSDVTDLINALAWMANSDSVIHISYGRTEGLAYRMSDLTVNTVRRVFGSNDPMQATASMTFVESVPLPAPSATQKKPTPKQKPATSTPKQKTRSYTVRSGDTLSAIALRFYGDANDWPKIAKANKIRNPDRIFPGQRLVIP